MNSVPLSEQMAPGVPCLASSHVRIATMSFAFIRRSTSSAKHSRVNSSTTVNLFNLLPSEVSSVVKSQHHTWFLYSAFFLAQLFWLYPRARFRRFRSGFRKPSSRHSRCTRLRFTFSPSLRSSRVIRR